MLTTIFSAVGGKLVDSILGKVTGVFESYFKKQISIEELKTQVSKALLESFTEVEKSHSETLAKTYESFQQTVRTSPAIATMFKVVIYSQVFVLVWHQWFIPFYLHFFAGPGVKYPSSGTTAEWAYLLIGGLCGAAPMLLRAGPGEGTITDKLKRMVGK